MRKIVLLASFFFSFFNFNYGQATSYLQESDIYNATVQGVFDNRCVACHSCLESPCQVNLQSHDGLMRGLNKENPYNGTRLNSAKPTRMFIDAHSTEQWIALGFQPILSKIGAPSEDSVLLNSLLMSQSQDRQNSDQSAQKSRMCVSNSDDPESYKNNTALSMPYNLAALTKQEISQIKYWLDIGRPEPKKVSVRTFEMSDVSTIQNLEALLNSTDTQKRVVARYLYEHLFLADIYFNEVANQQPKFYRLIRSKKSCNNPEVIATSTPNQDPGVDFPFYCVVNNPKTVAAKNHIPYKLDQSKIEWLKSNFFGKPWTEAKFVPDYKPMTAANPFAAFRWIPIEARYKFLLEDSWYHVMTFIKGPVCNGNNALDSIQNQFYVFFTDPKQDLAIKNQQYGRLLRKFDDLPGQLGVDVQFTDAGKEYAAMHKHRKNNRDYKNQFAKVSFPKGRGLEIVWDGNGNNKNALLTVLRHGDYSSVHQGAVGAPSKSAFLLDYSIFERLVYNLVVNFDVYGNVGHQLLSRMYMDIIRMDAENNFLELLPEDSRKDVKKSWYKGSFGITSLKMSLINEYNFSDVKSNVIFKTEDYKTELLQKLIHQRIPKTAQANAELTNDALSNRLNYLSTREIGYNQFARYFPELIYLVVTENGVEKDFYSIAATKELENPSWIFFEQRRRAPEEDSLIVSRDLLGTSPSLIIRIEKSKVSRLVDDALQIDSEESYQAWKEAYRIDRLGSQFWPTYDAINSYFMKRDPVRAGVIDLTRYELVD